MKMAVDPNDTISIRPSSGDAQGEQGTFRAR
jgi:hypothetical protein